MLQSLLTLACFVPALAWGGQAGAQASVKNTGQAIALKAERANKGFASERIRFELVLVNAQGDKTERRLTVAILESGEEDLSRITFEWPASVRGTTLLTHSDKAGNDEQWLYLPAVKRTRRISSGHRTGSFMGSEFTYEDLSSPVVAKYTHRHLKDEQVGDRGCHVLERKPRDDWSGYSKQIVWLDKERLVPLKVEYYDRKGELSKVATHSGYAKYERFYRPREIRMENRQTKKVSILTATARSLGEKLDPLSFQSQTLGS